MPRFLGAVTALCFFADVIFLVVTALATPDMARLESQPMSYSVILTLSALVPALLSLTYRPGAGVVVVTLLVLSVYFLFFLATIFYLVDYSPAGERVLSDFFISGVMISKGCAIGALLTRGPVFEYFLRYLIGISLLLSTLYVVILISQLRLGMLYPGIGGATYQRASYILAQLFALNTFYLFFKSSLGGWKIFCVTALCGVLFFGVLYNGGRGAFLAIFTLCLYYVFRMRLTSHIRSFLSLRITKTLAGSSGLLILLVFFVGNSVQEQDLELLLRGTDRIFEVVIQFVNTGTFDTSAVSARDVVYSIVWDGISRQPIFGYGPLWDSRLVIPPHNIFLSFILQYGIFIGGLLSVSLVLTVIYCWRNEGCKKIILLLLPSLIYLLFSGSYLQSFEVWLLITILCHNLFENFGRNNEVSVNT